jgi:hypothetical protein
VKGLVQVCLVSCVSYRVLCQVGGRECSICRIGHVVQASCQVGVHTVQCTYAVPIKERDVWQGLCVARPIQINAVYAACRVRPACWPFHLHAKQKA